MGSTTLAAVILRTNSRHTVRRGRSSLRTSHSTVLQGPGSSGGEDGPGTYVRKHEPAISFQDISTDARRCAQITDFTHFDPTASDFELVVPNLCNDMHDCSVTTGDQWLATFVPRITSSASFQNSALFITWDEGTTTVGGGGHVPTVVVSPLTSIGYQSATAHTHYSLLRTVQDAWGLPCLNLTCGASNMGEFFGALPVAASAASDASATAIPILLLCLSGCLHRRDFRDPTESTIALNVHRRQVASSPVT